LVDVALPGERLTGDELLSCCFEDPDPTAVLATQDGEGVVVVVVRGGVGFLQLVAVSPAAQGEGRGRLLVEAAQRWAMDAGADEVWVAGASPFTLWPGIDVSWTRALCMFEAAGYEPVGAVLGMSCPTTFRQAAPEGIDVHRVLDDSEAAAVLDVVGTSWPSWRQEVARGIEHGAALVAVDDGAAVIGFACHSVNRTAVVGPLGVVTERRRRGVGGALLSAACYDLRAAGIPDAQFWITGGIEFLARSAGASVGRVYRTARWRSRSAR
jgi:GNAT superfamily N-acetyltransferase